MVLCGERVDAATALRIRLVEEVVPRAQGAGRARCSLRLRQDHKAGHEVAAFDLSAGANERWGAEGLRIAACRA
jgi:enoyl-CoA hydratase/carnithine racemase